MLENLEISKYVIVVLSKHYLSEPLNKFELDLAIEQLYSETACVKRIIPVYIEKGLPDRQIPKHLTCMMRKNEVLEWSDDPNASELMKRTLIDILSGGQNAVVDLETE